MTITTSICQRQKQAVLTLYIVRTRQEISHACYSLTDLLLYQPRMLCGNIVGRISLCVCLSVIGVTRGGGGEWTAPGDTIHVVTPE